MTYATDTSRGRPSSSASQPRQTSPATADAGPITYRPAFWSHVEVNQSAASADGSEPPMTNPKNRPDWLAMIPG